MEDSVRIFVFGSNLAGRHGKGAALFALQNHGAMYGQGEGRQGNSYAIPTKGKVLDVLELREIQRYVYNFVRYAREHPELEFDLTPIGCGLAGYKQEQIKPLFKEMPNNIFFTSDWY